MRFSESIDGVAKAAPSSGGWDWNLAFLAQWRDPLMVVARLMLAYIFITEGYGKIGSYAGVAEYMQAHGVPSFLLPLVIVTELGGGLLVLFGLYARWAAIALMGFCLLTAFIFHASADEVTEMQKNIAMAGGFLALAVAGPGMWSLDRWRGL